VRSAYASGQFYPSDARELQDTLDDLLSAVDSEPRSGRLRMLIVPHAGYVFSGGVAAQAFKTLYDTGYRRAVLIGRSHREAFDGVAADNHDHWSTPLGEVKVDQRFIDRLMAQPGVDLRRAAGPHAGEHSLEVAVPFLQRVIGGHVSVVPLLLGKEDYDEAEALAIALSAVMDDSTLVIISTDLSHYPSYEDAEHLDGMTVKGIMTGDADKFRAVVQSVMAERAAGEETAACGEIAVAVGLHLAGRYGWRPTMLGYANSGDVDGGDRSRVVGYAAVAFDGPAAIELAAGSEDLDEAAQREALEIARQTLEAHFRGGKHEPVPASRDLRSSRGVFVTLKKHGELRGCVGVFEPVGSLADAIRDMTLAAAFGDARFHELSERELSDLKIEVSVLSPLTEIADPRLVEVGRHGVAVSRDDRYGAFLPQVAVEQGWDRDTFLHELCVSKAGFEEACWDDPGTQLKVFTAQVFGE